jgi:choline dehydrogenase-like flavoprotein
LEAVRRGATLLPPTRCGKIVFENKRATGSLAEDKKGNFLEISGAVIILAAGGVDTPAVLKKSGILEAGQKFFFDPLTYYE